MSEKVLKIILIVIALIALAVLVLPFTAEAQTHIHRSIQNTATAIWTSGGTITFTITGDTIGTFSSPMPDSIGRGVAIEYDSTGSSSVKAIAFIKYRISSTQVGLQRFQGGNPSPASATTTWNMFHAYTTWEKFHNGDENDGINNTVENFDAHTDGINIDARSEYWHVAMYAGNHDLTGTQGGDDMNTSSTEILEIYAPCGTKFVGTSQRHTGKLTYRGPVFTVTTGEGWPTSDDAGTRVCQDVIFDGLQWDFSDVDATIGVRINAAATGVPQNFHFRDCIFHGSDSTATNATDHVAIKWTGGGNAGGIVRISNSLFYGWKTTAATTNEGAVLFTAGNIAAALWINNSTFYRNEQGVRRTTAGNQLLIKNCVFNRSADGMNGGVTGDKNVSDISSDCAGCTNEIVGTVAFTAQSSGDFSLQSGDTVAKNAGADLSAADPAITKDIKGYARSGTYDCGAFEQGAAASGCSTETDVAASSSVTKRRRVPPQ